MKDKMKRRRLQELDRSDFEIVKDEPDIRGWDVKLASGHTVGEVEELILDAQDKKVRYMVISLHDVKELDLMKRKVLVPIGLAELDNKEDDVLIPRITAPQLMNLPEYEKDHLTPEVERQICITLGRDFNKMAQAERNKLAEQTRKKEVTEPSQEKKSAPEEADPDFYRHEYYNLDTLYKNRMHEAQPMNRQNEYDEGLRLWEKRSEGGLPEPGPRQRQEPDEKQRAEVVKHRRSTYEERRYRDSRDDNRSADRKDHSIIDRIKNEGLRDT